MRDGNKLYLECYSGISGDMTVAALLDLGADEEALMKTLATIPVKGFRVEISRVKKSGIDACDFNVILDAAHENHDHDMEYLYGHEHTHTHGDHTHEEHAHGEHIHGDHIHEEHTHGDHTHEEHAHGEHIHEAHVHGEHIHEAHVHGEHTHEAHTHGDHAHYHHHEHRGINEIREIVNRCDMTDGARALTMKIFNILAEAESKAHNVPIDQVHFHEVGAVDSIVDIIAAAVCFDNLQIGEVIVPVLCEGHGTVRCQHGILPIPVPAVANIIQAHQLPVQIVNAEGEFVTPTGAAIVAAVKTSEVLPKEFKAERIGIGAGKRQYDRPGILRAMIIKDQSEEKDTIYKLETNVDDCSGEALGYVMEQLFLAGARDVHYTPVFMKKNRPGWQMNVICSRDDVEKLEQIIFRETTTIGIRRVEMERTVLKRENITVNTDFGQVEVKVCDIEGRKRYYPEYESVARLSRDNHVPFSAVYQMAVEKCF